MGARRSNSNPRTQLPPSSSSPMEPNYSIPELDDQTHLSGSYIRNLVKNLATPSSSSSSSASPPSTPLKTHQKPHKKQVRRRLHTTKPYQERLLNMAEARKEIVTALKFHRATMKQKQSQPPPPPPPEFTEPPLVLPSQTLGLNLSSFHDLTNLDAACLYSSAEVEVSSPVEIPGGGDSGEGDRRQGIGPRALGDSEMEEIKCIGEMHEMEWNDTLNLANSAWWFKFLSNMDAEQDLGNLSPTDACGGRQFERAVELPLYWEGDFGNFYQPRHLDLPCMKIEDIEGLEDQKWLS